MLQLMALCKVNVKMQRFLKAIVKDNNKKQVKLPADQLIVNKKFKYIFMSALDTYNNLNIYFLIFHLFF